MLLTRPHQEFLEKPSYKLHDVCRALDVLGAECDLIQAEVYKNSHFMGQGGMIRLYDDTNYYFEIELGRRQQEIWEGANTDRTRSSK